MDSSCIDSTSEGSEIPSKMGGMSESMKAFSFELAPPTLFGSAFAAPVSSLFSPAPVASVSLFAPSRKETKHLGVQKTVQKKNGMVHTPGRRGRPPKIHANSDKSSSSKSSPHSKASRLPRRRSGTACDEHRRLHAKCPPNCKGRKEPKHTKREEEESEDESSSSSESS